MLTFISINRNANQIAKHIIYWFVFMLFFTMVWGTYDNDYYRNFMVQLLSLPSRLILVYVTLYILFPLFFLKKKYIKFVLFYVLLLISATIFIQRPLVLNVIQPLYLKDFESSSFFAITEIMNTLLDVNVAAIIPFVYVLFKNFQTANKKRLALEIQQQDHLKEEEFIYLKVEKSLIKIFIKDIIYIESQKNYIKLETTEREIIAHKSISSIEELLPEKQFLRVHRSYIVAIKFIDSFSPSKLILKGISIPVGRKFKDEVKAILGYF